MDENKMNEETVISITDNKDIYCCKCGIKLLPEEAFDSVFNNFVRYYCAYHYKIEKEKEKERYENAKTSKI